jgi:hypothetical protein
MERIQSAPFRYALALNERRVPLGLRYNLSIACIRKNELAKPPHA